MQPHLQENGAHHQQQHYQQQMTFEQAPRKPRSISGSAPRRRSINRFRRDSLRLMNHASFSSSGGTTLGASSAEYDKDLDDQNRLRPSLISLHNKLQRDYHMHNLAQAQLLALHFLFFFIPSSLLTLTGGILALMYFASNDTLIDRDLRNLLVTLFIFVAALLQGVSNYLSIFSRAVAHRHTAKELRKLSNRLEENYFSSDLNIMSTFTRDKPQEKRIRLPRHEMVLFQQLYDQIVACCPVLLPRSFVQAFNYMDVRMEALLESLCEEHLEPTGWLMPLVYESLERAIREAFLWPLIMLHDPRWYTERVLDSLLEPTSLLQQLDDPDGEKVALNKKERKKKEKAEKFRKVLLASASRKTILETEMERIAQNKVAQRDFFDHNCAMDEGIEEEEMIYPDIEDGSTASTTFATNPSFVEDNPTYTERPKTPPILTSLLGRCDSSTNEVDFLFEDDDRSSKGCDATGGMMAVPQTSVDEEEEEFPEEEEYSGEEEFPEEEEYSEDQGQKNNGNENVY